MIKEFSSVPSLDIDLAKRRDIADANRAPRCQHLAVNALPPGLLALSRIPLRPEPHARLDKHRALLLCPVMRWRQAERLEVSSRHAPCQGSNCNRRVGRAIDRRSRLRNGLAGNFCHDRDCRDIGGLALVCCHPQCCIALEMFDRFEAFLVGKFHILHRDIVLEIKPGARLRFCHMPQRLNGYGRILCIGNE